MKKILIIHNGDHEYKPFIINSFEKLKNFEIEVIYNYKKKKTFDFISKIFHKIRLPLDSTKFNYRIIQKYIDFKPSFIIVIKGNNIYPSTLKKIKKIDSKVKIFSWTADNMLKKHNSSIYFDLSLKLYDIHFTTKSNIVNDLYKLGAKKVVFLNKAYSKEYHYPVSVKDKYKFDVLFIGTAERQRYNYMQYLAKNGIKVNIFGNLWNKSFKSSENLIIHRKELINNDYRSAISSSLITLCFLRKINDDQQTSRSIEIPACKGFMIAEKTEEHLNLFKNEEEAVFFKNKNEMLELVLFYLENDDKREKIRERGYLRVINCNYSYDDMINKMINSFN